MCSRWPSFALAAAIAAGPGRPAGADDPPDAHTAAQRERLKERDRPDEKANTPGDQRIPYELVAEVVAKPVIGWLETQAGLHETRDDWAGALSVRREILALCTKTWGESDWRSANALGGRGVERHPPRRRRTSAVFSGGRTLRGK